VEGPKKKTLHHPPLSASAEGRIVALKMTLRIYRLTIYINPPLTKTPLSTQKTSAVNKCRRQEMPSPTYEMNKAHVQKWKEAHKERVQQISRKGSKTYYEKHAKEILAKKKQRYEEKKAQKMEEEANLASTD
jgi:hypothetical protein